MPFTHRSFGEGGLPPEAYRDLVRQALAGDRGRGDVTSAATVARGIRARGTILAKGDLVIIGEVENSTPRHLFGLRLGF